MVWDGSSGSVSRSTPTVVAEQLAGTFDGGLQHLMDGQPVDDPPL